MSNRTRLGQGRLGVVSALVLALVATTFSPVQPAAAAVATIPTTSSGTPAALTDGAPAEGRLGAEWSASQVDATPWVKLSYSSARRIASVQIFGSKARAFDPKQSTASALHGTLRFSDGSTVKVSGIAADAEMPTTIAFTPRETTSVTLELRRQIPDAPLALRELSAYEAGTTPPRWAPRSTAPRYSVVPAAAVCSSTASSLTAGKPAALTLACPTPGASVEDAAVVSINAPVGARLTAYTSWATELPFLVPLRRSATAVADGGGRATLTVDARRLARGPFAVKVTGEEASGRHLEPLYVQLFHAKGSESVSAGRSAAATAMTLQYSEDFSGPLSISQTGWGSDYAAVKPEPWGGSQFGSSVFADPTWGAGTLATLPGGFLRIRNQDIGAYADKQSWQQPHISGIVSSQRFGGSGFSAQYGYFEARILGAPGPGAWPAFWMMNSESGTGRANGTSGELDAVELYGHDTNGACNTTHSWGPAKTGQLQCEQYAMDWAAEWHTYGARVFPGGAEFFIDGKSVGKLDQLSHTDEPFFFMLNLATGGGWPVDLSATGQTTDMYVDWVRVYT